jgi:hypothetical protein
LLPTVSQSALISGAIEAIAVSGLAIRLANEESAKTLTSKHFSLNSKFQNFPEYSRKFSVFEDEST